MFGLFEYLFPSPPPVPVTRGASLLFPDEEMDSDQVLVGFVKDYNQLDLRIYMEFGVGAAKYFRIYKVNSAVENSRQIRTQEQRDFSITGEEFNSLQNGAEQHCIYRLHKSEAKLIFDRLEKIFWQRSSDENSPDRREAYSTVINSIESQPIISSLNYEQRERVAHILARNRYGRPSRNEDTAKTGQTHTTFINP